MNRIKLFAVAALALWMAACGNGNNKMESADATISDLSVSADSTAAEGTVLQAGNIPDTAGTFIRTADIRFEVGNVVQATSNIEHTVANNGGFIVFTNLVSNKDNVSVVPVSKDSSLETTYYTVTNQVTLRVPNYLLDTTLRSIAADVAYLDHRQIKADDVSLLLKSGSLTERRLAAHAARIARDIDSKGKKLTDITSAEDQLNDVRESADEQAIQRLSLTNQVKYSTVTLELYQRQAVRKVLVCNEQQPPVYVAPFTSRLADAFTDGWDMLLGIVVFLTRAWLIVLLLVLAIILRRRISFGTQKSV